MRLEWGAAAGLGPTLWPLAFSGLLTALPINWGTWIQQIQFKVLDITDMLTLFIIFSLYFASMFLCNFLSLNSYLYPRSSFLSFPPCPLYSSLFSQHSFSPDPNHDLLVIRRHHLSHVPLDQSVLLTLQGISHFSLPTTSLMPFLKYSPVRKLTLSLRIPLWPVSVTVSPLGSPFMSDM